MKEWPLLPVKELCSLVVDCVNKTAPIIDYETPFKMIRTTNIRHGRVNMNDCRNVTQETYEKWTRRAKVLSGDVLLTREAPLGEVGFIHNDTTYFLGQRIMQYRANRNIVEPRYLYYAFRSKFVQDQIHSHSGTGSVVDHIRVPDCEKFLIPVPPKDLQLKIANMIGDLDDRIDLNNQINETLENLAKAIFKEWFIDIGPVKAKMEGKKPFGMDDETAGLFPDSFEESELGPIPKGWEVGSIYEVADVKYGAPFSSKNFNNEKNGFPIVRIRDLKNQTPELYTDEINERGFKTYHGQILVGMDGEFRAYIWSGPESWVNQRVCEFVPKPFCRAFTFFAIQKPLYEIESTETATTVIHLGKNDIDRFRIAFPPMELIKQFSNVIENLYDLIIANSQENISLINLRDILLPKLISGEIEI